MLTAQGVCFAYPGSSRLAVEAVSLGIAPGEIVALMGASGSGKTTLARILGGSLRPVKGRVCADGICSELEADRRNYRRRVGIVLSEPDYQLIGETVEEELAFGLANLGLAPDTIEQRIAAALHRAGMEGYAGYPPRFLSGGLKQKLLLLAFNLLEPAYLILDEPFQMLDQAGKMTAGDCMSHLARTRGEGILFCTHDAEDALCWADRILVMQSGRLAGEMTGSEAMERSEWLESTGIRPPELAVLRTLLLQKELLHLQKNRLGAAAPLTPEGLAEELWQLWLKT